MTESLWRVSTDTSLQALLDDSACPALLSSVLTGVHSWQLRNETSVGKCLRASRLMPQCVAALVALGATVAVDDGETETNVAVEAVARREVKGEIISLQISGHADARWGRAQVARTPADDPIVAASVVVRSDGDGISDARLALTGVSSEPVWLADLSDVVLGRALDGECIRDAAASVEEAVEPQGDYLGSAEYRRAMSSVLTRRALEACLE